jgi:hypothetical protein
MARTRTELVHEALKNLGALPQGHTPDAETSASVNARIDGLIERLAERDVVYVTDVDAIPDLYFEPLGVVLAHACQSEFGADLTAAMETAEHQLREMSRQGPTYEILKGTYF